MSETEKNEIILSLRSQLTGDLTSDLKFLEAQAAQYVGKEDGDDIAAAITELAVSLMPQQHLDFMKKTIYIGERRLDLIYKEAEHLMLNRMNAKSLVLTKQLYDKIREVFTETENTRFFSFRNLLESNLYYIMYHPTKRLEKAPFDFVRFLMAHAYNLIELRRPAEAIPVLEEAIRFNPVCPDPRFELAEAYKLMKEPEKLLAVVRETLPVCASPYALSRCYANLGYYCVEKKEYDKAICFYFESIVYTDHPAIRAELRHVAKLKGEEIKPPTRKDVLQAFADLELPNGPDPNVLTVASALADQAMEKSEWKEASFYLRVFHDLTHDEEAGKLLSKCEEEIKKMEGTE